MKLGLDIGCGDNKANAPGVEMLGYDIRPLPPHVQVAGDVRNLPFKSKSFDYIVSSHVLEHLRRSEWQATLAEWCRIVKDDGQFWLILPNIMWAAKRLHEDGFVDTNVLNVLYGGQDNPFDFHYNGFTPNLIKMEFEKLGFELFHFDTKSYNMFFGAKRAQVD